MPKFVHIDIPADDLDRAARFWEGAFGFSLQGMGDDYPYRLLMDGSDGVGGVGLRNQTAGEVPVPTLEVDDVDEAMTKVEAAGGVSLGEKQPVGDMGWYRRFQDTEGNTFGLWHANR